MIDANKLMGYSSNKHVVLSTSQTQAIFSGSCKLFNPDKLTMIDLN